jgi:hypothetical protein
MAGLRVAWRFFVLDRNCSGKHFVTLPSFALGWVTERTWCVVHLGELPLVGRGVTSGAPVEVARHLVFPG